MSAIPERCFLENDIDHMLVRVILMDEIDFFPFSRRYTQSCNFSKMFKNVTCPKAERARLHFDSFNGKERNEMGKVGVSSPVHTLDSSV